MSWEASEQFYKGEGMKVGTSRFAVIAVITSLLLIGASTTTWAEDCALSAPDYSSNFNANQGCIQLNGNSASFADTGDGGPFVLRLTTSNGGQYASAWFTPAQPLQNGFSTTFEFQFTNLSGLPADGIAFVIQSSSTGAIGFGGEGGPLAYGDSDENVVPSAGTGIPHSLAIEFDTYQNGWDNLSTPHVAIQSCGSGPNTSHHNRPCSTGGPSSTLGPPVSLPNLTAGIHTVTITYALACSSCQPVTTSNNLHVIVDNVDLYPDGVNVNLNTLGLLDGDRAYVGFTGATGGQFQTQDILNWTFTPTSQSVVVTTGTQTTVPFQNDAYNYTAQLNSGNPTTLQITPILMDPTDCDTLVQKNPLFQGANGAHCFVYKDAFGSGTDKSVLFEVTCPQLSSTAECNPLDADLGTQFDLSANNPNFDSTNPFPGWLKGNGTVQGFPCTPNPNGVTPLFQSNQINYFALARVDPVTKGRSGGTGSCWVATYNTPNEAPTVQIHAPVDGANYQLNQNDPATKANYECHTVDTRLNNATSTIGPYLTPTSCSATDTPGGTVNSGDQFDTTMPGLHTFTAKVVDSATDNASQTVTYNVVSPADLAILKLAPLLVRAGGTITYTIGVGNLGGSNAVGVVVNDTLPADTTLVGSPSGNNVSCAIVNRRLTCTTTPMSCPPGPTVTCSSTTPIAPLSLSSLNGATVKITVKLGSTWTAGKVVKNTANVSSTNADPKPNNNSSTAATLVTR